MDMKMMRSSRLAVSLFTIMQSLVLAGSTVASDPQKNLKNDLQNSKSASAATVETIRRAAVKNIAARYNLNDLQLRLTDELMEREVYRFLTEHEETVWPAIRDLLSCQLGANPPGVEKSRQIGKSVLPIIAEAKKAIFQANDEWRTILSDDQKTMHDWDMSEMEKQFQKINQNMKGWADGLPNSQGLFPTQDMSNSPPKPKLPVEGWIPDGSSGESPPDVRVVEHSPTTPLPKTGPSTEKGFHPDVFEKFVEEFIKEYHLGQGQIDSARSILKEYKDKAASYCSKSSAHLTLLETREKEAQRPFDRKAMAEIHEQRKQLLQPIYDLFGKMEERLKALLNRTQLAQYREKQLESPTVEDQPKKPAKEGSAKTESVEKKKDAKSTAD